MYHIGTNPNAPLGGAWPAEPQSAAPANSWSAGRGDVVSTAGYAALPGATPFGSQLCAPSGGASASSFTGGLGGVMASFFNAIQNVFAQIQSSLNGTGGSTSPGTPGCAQPSTEQGFTSATASSLGDPHLAFDATSAGGATQRGKWDDMHSHADLVDSDSFAGGYDVSTNVTAPNASGVTYNRSATVTTDDGAACVSYAHDGSLRVTENGQSVAVVKGQSVDLGNGETVTSNADGSATVAQANGSGGSISTTLNSNGAGVDVTTSASNVDLGGYLVTGRDASVTAAAGPSPAPTGSTLTGDGPVAYVPIYADPNTLAGGTWNAGGVSGTVSGPGSWDTAQSARPAPYQLAGFSEPSVDDELI